MAYEASSPTMPNRSNSEEPILAEFAEPRTGSRVGPWLTGLVALLMAGAAGLVLVVLLIPQELQRWRLAAAEEQRLNGDFSGAVQKLNREIEAYPGDLRLLLQRSRWLLEDQQYSEALNDVNQYLSQHPDDVMALRLRASIHQALGNFDDAVDDWKQILGSEATNSIAARADAMNGLAYAQSLANVEIEQGLTLVDEAMRLLGEDYAMLDTRGFLYYRLGDWERSLTDLDNAVEFAEAKYAATVPAIPQIADRRLKKKFDRQQSQTLAVIRYHRSLVHDSRRDFEKAEADRQRVRELGFEPNESLF
jgi:tetratricopeptide (TPR) repeat protein